MMGKGGMVKKRSKIIFLNITLADFLVTLFPMLGIKIRILVQSKVDLFSGQLIWEIMEREWVAGWLFCKVFKFIQTYALASSNYMLVALAMDRHRAVTQPVKVYGSLNRLVEYSEFVN
jgi:hypothetical protein